MNAVDDITPELSSRSRSSEHGDPTWLFMIVTAGLIVGSIVQLLSPHYGVNDGSRWNTVYYLVEHGTYEYLPDHDAWWGNPYPTSPAEVPPFRTIDMIRVPDAQGQQHYYSSKPPFLPTCLAGVVWLIEKATFGAADFRKHPYFIIRTTLILVQVIPLFVCFWMILKYIRRQDDTPFVRNFCAAAVTFGTYLTAWVVTLNNHTIAACAAFLTVYTAIRICYDDQRQAYRFAVVGFGAVFTAFCELPAGLLAIALLTILLMKDQRKTLLFGLPAAALPTAVGLYANYVVTGSILPAYVQIHKKAGFYDWPGSPWINLTAQEALNDPKLLYLFNMLLGHHGFFILTPVLIICLIGLVRHLRQGPDKRRALAAGTLVLTSVIVAVYVMTTHNYGGATKGSRWLFWLIPFWLLFLADGVRWLATNRSGRFACYACLAVSAMSVGDAMRWPWGVSWLQDIFRQLHWIDF